MHRSSHPIETEIKLAVSDLAATRRLLRRSGFRVAIARHFEINLLFDHTLHKLRDNGLTLRLRKSGRRWVLTYKGPTTTGRHKSRTEIETDIPNGEVFVSILQNLGFQQSFRYEKFRTVFQAEGKRGLIMLDETPIGAYLELEGTASWIDRTAAALGFPEADYITSSYTALFRRYSGRKSTSKQSGMVFGKN